jgi:LysW-gamma-L-lysine carboxypeptidase
MDDLALLEGLLQRYSPSHQESAAAAYLVSAMTEMGFSAAVDAVGNAVGSRGSGPAEIMLLGHIDTVPGLNPVRQEGDWLYGRGAVDAKGPLACFTAAAATLDPPPGWRITVIGAVGEESQSHGAIYLRDRYHPTMLVIGEPSKWDHITLGFKGSLWLDYTVQVSTAHTASGIDSAAELAVRFWDELSAWCAALNPPGSGPFNQLSPTLRGMRSSSDGFSETASLRIGLRLPPAVSPETAAGKINELKGPGELHFEEPIPAYKAEKNTPLVRAFLASIRAAGGTPVFSLKTGTSDMNLVAPAWNCPAVAYGPGDSTLDHTPAERISIEEYRRSIAVLSAVLRQLVLVI